MDPSRTVRGRTRRDFLRDAATLGIGAAALAALGPSSVLPAFAQQSGPRARIQVLMHDSVENSAADFARGQARGVQIASVKGRAVLKGAAGGEFISGPLAIPFPATHFGLHWVLPHDPPQTISVEVRSSDDGRNWSDWRSPSIEAVADLPQGREVFAALTSGRRGRFAQYRAVFQSGQVATLETMTVTAINSVDGPRSPVPATAAEPNSVDFDVAVAHGTTKKISVITRGGWQCDESLRFRGRKEIWPEMYVPAKKVVLHHTAGANDYTDGAAEVRAVYAYHARTLGWGDIGYNSLVDKYGNIYEGRHGRGEDANREILSADVVAGHAYGHNYGSTGIAAIGNSADSDWGSSVTGAMYGSIEDLATFECGRHYIDPLGASAFLKSDDTWHVDLQGILGDPALMRNVSGHYESYDTECPGTALIERYLTGSSGYLAQTVAGRLGGTAAPALSSDAKTDPAPSTLSFTWPADGGPYEYCFEGWSKPATSDDIQYLSGYESATEYSDSLAMKQLWAPAEGTSMTLSASKVGHYTMHLRSASGKYEANLTYMVRSVTDSPPPETGLTVTGINPSTIKAGSSVDVTITGSGFADGAAVTFKNGDPPQPTVVATTVKSDTTIEATVTVGSMKKPPKDAKWDVIVTVGGSSGTLADGLTVTR